MNIEWILSEYWVNIEWILSEYWVNITWILSEYRENTEGILKGYWVDIEGILREYWGNIEWILRQTCQLKLEKNNFISLYYSICLPIKQWLSTNKCSGWEEVETLRRWDLNCAIKTSKLGKVSLLVAHGSWVERRGEWYEDDKWNEEEMSYIMPDWVPTMSTQKTDAIG